MAFKFHTGGKLIVREGDDLFSPSSLSGLRLWLDMNDQSTFTNSGGNVTAIADKSVNNYTFYAAGGSTIKAVNAAQNNKNILRFDNNSDATSDSDIAFSSTAVHKWFFAVKVTASDLHDALVTFNKSNPTLQVIMFNFSGANTFSGDWYFHNGNHLTGNSSNILNQFCLLSLELDVPSAKVTASLNGTAYDTNVSQSVISTFGPGKLKLNDYINNADSDWGEAIFTENISQGNSNKIEGYLAQKWGLSLPSSHPYKNGIPKATTFYINKATPEYSFNVSIRDTQSNILARTSDPVGTIAYATDTCNLLVKQIDGYDEFTVVDDDDRALGQYSFNIDIRLARAEILARTNDPAGTIAYATDTEQILIKQIDGYDEFSLLDDDS